MPTAAPTHTFKVKKAKSLNARPNAYQRGYGGKDWYYDKRRIFKRDLYKCQICGEQTQPKSEDKSRWPNLDHIIPKRRGGSNDDTNLQTLCQHCHSVKSMRERMK